MKSIFLPMNSNTVLMHSMVSDSMENDHFFGNKSNEKNYSADFILGVLLRKVGKFSDNSAETN